MTLAVLESTSWVEGQGFRKHPDYNTDIEPRLAERRMERVNVWLFAYGRKTRSPYYKALIQESRSIGPRVFDLGPLCDVAPNSVLQVWGEAQYGHETIWFLVPRCSSLLADLVQAYPSSRFIEGSEISGQPHGEFDFQEAVQGVGDNFVAVSFAGDGDPMYMCGDSGFLSALLQQYGPKTSGSQAG